jgi:hypothetical protein
LFFSAFEFSLFYASINWAVAEALKLSDLIAHTSYRIERFRSEQSLTLSNAGSTGKLNGGGQKTSCLRIVGPPIQLSKDISEYTDKLVQLWLFPRNQPGTP